MKKYIYILLVIELLSSCAYQNKLEEGKYNMNLTSKDQGIVIILNGPSASGKTSVQKKIQEIFDEPFVKLGIDTLFDNVLPDYYGLGMVNPRGKFSQKDIRFVEEVEIDQAKAIKLVVGPVGRKVIKGMHYSLAAYARCENNIVVDYILYEKDWFRELVDALKDLKVYYIGFKYPLEEIEKREKKRATSPVGHARSHFNTVHAFSNYDLVIDDIKLSAEEIAFKIKAFIKSNPNPKSFRNYLKQFKNT